MTVFVTPIAQAADFGGGGYNIVCADGGRYLNVYAGKDADGTNVCVWERDGSPEQNYTIIACGDGKYKLQPDCSPSRVIDVNRGNSYDNPLKAGLNVDLWRTNDAPAQEFCITHVGGNLYKIELAALPGNVLQANNPNKNNGNVTLERYSGASNQHWKILKNGTQITEPCAHKNISVKNEKFTAEQNNADSHTKIRIYDEVCDDCGKTVSADVKETKAENHDFVDGRCAVCGYETPKTEEEPDTTTEKNNTTEEKPDKAELGVNKTDFTPGEKIELSWTAANRASSYDIHINKDGMSARYRLDSGFTGSSASIVISDEGVFDLAIYSINSQGYTRGNSVKVTVKSKYSERTAYVYNTGGSNLNMRSQANTASSIVAKIPAGASLTVTGETVNGFCPVKYNGKSGYASAAYITFDKPASAPSSNISSQLGKRIASVYSYPKGTSRIGECVWYVRGRAAEKLGVNTGITGNGCQWFGVAKARGLATGRAVRSNSIACFGATKKNSYGHVIFVEEVVGNNVYYTEANVEKPYSDGKISPMDGVLKVKSVSAFTGGAYQGCIYLK